MLLKNPSGNYQFLQGIDPYSCGVIADDGFELVRVTLLKRTEWKNALDIIEGFLDTEKIHISALAALEFRSPVVRSMNDFISFNSEYIAQLQTRGLLLDSVNPIARTNVVPFYERLSETVIYAFTYVRSCLTPHYPSFIVAGSGELIGSGLKVENIVRYRDLSSEGLSEKIVAVEKTMTERLMGLGVDWSQVTSTSVYTLHEVEKLVDEYVSKKIGAANRFGLQTFRCRPPVEDIEFEMDTRCVTKEFFLTGQ